MHSNPVGPDASMRQTAGATDIWSSAGSTGAGAPSQRSGTKLRSRREWGHMLIMRTITPVVIGLGVMAATVACSSGSSSIALSSQGSKTPSPPAGSSASASSVSMPNPCPSGMAPDKYGVCNPGGKVPSGVSSATSAPTTFIISSSATPSFHKTFKGSGDYGSPQFDVSACQNGITVKYSYVNNTTGSGGDNSIAALESSSDDQTITNDIAVSGGKATTVYPDTSGGSTEYHLSVQADSNASWQFDLSCA